MKQIIIGTIIILVLGFGSYALSRKHSMPNSSPTTVASTALTTPQNLPTSTPVSTPTPTLYYPISDYDKRLTLRPHGKYFVLKDGASLPCGGEFSGFHAGDDLEVSAEERKDEIPIYAITSGIVRLAAPVNGYGGLLVLEHTINNQTYTAYYGHLDTKQVTLKVGSSVVAGERIAYLGDHCSAETSNQRKHLHFTIRKSSTIDVRGYVPAESELAAWVNPQIFLKENQAAIAN